jgi:hypothetical protein
MKIFNKIKRLYYKRKNVIPIHKCKYFKKHGCKMVYGPYCKFPHCTILHEYLGDEFKFCYNCNYNDLCCDKNYGYGCYDNEINHGIKI